MPSRPLIIDANILIRAVLCDRVRALIKRYCGAVVFYVAEPNVEEATEYLVERAAKRGVADETWRQSL